TSTPKSDPSGDYAWQAFQRAEQVKPGAYAVLDAKALKLVDRSAPRPGAESVHAPGAGRSEIRGRDRLQGSGPGTQNLRPTASAHVVDRHRAQVVPGEHLHRRPFQRQRLQI